MVWRSTCIFYATRFYSPYQYTVVEDSLDAPLTVNGKKRFLLSWLQFAFLFLYWIVAQKGYNGFISQLKYKARTKYAAMQISPF